MRITLDIIILISILFWPWYISAVLLLAGMIAFERFYEAFIAALMLDILYHIPESTFMSSWLHTIVVMITYGIVHFFQSRIRA